MVEGNEGRRDGLARAGNLPGLLAGQAAPASPSGHGFGWKVWLVLKTLQARLRFVALLAAVGGLIAYWDTLTA
jgi:hypothetical protein